MNIYESDEEKAEAIKKWWKDNGTSVVLGIVIGLGAVFGWRAWSSYRDSVDQQASAAFEQLVVTADRKGTTESAQEQAKLIDQDYSGSPYASLAALINARVEANAGKMDAAHTALEQAIDKAPDPGIARIAALRLIRVLISEGKLDEASAAIEKYDDGGAFAPDFDALRGDVAAASGHNTEAREAYTKAIADGAADAELIRLKLDNLPPAG